MKKLLCFALAAVLTLTMSISGFCAELTTENRDAGMTISTTVPAVHKITVVYNEGGYVLINGKLCPSGTEITVDRFGEIDLDVICGKDHHIEKIMVNGEDVTEQFMNGTLKLENIVEDVYVEFFFESCASDPDDDCFKTDMEGVVYLGDKKVVGADLKFDFGEFTAKTDEDGRYYLEDISEGHHIVTISKDGEMLGTCEFTIVVSDEYDEVTVVTLPDGTQIVYVPSGTEQIYLDFIIADENGDGIPDVDPSLTDPTIPPEGGFGSTDRGNTGTHVAVGSPKEEKKPSIIDKIPQTGALIAAYPEISAGVLVITLFFILLLIFKRKKKDEEQPEG